MSIVCYLFLITCLFGCFEDKSFLGTSWRHLMDARGQELSGIDRELVSLKEKKTCTCVYLSKSCSKSLSRWWCYWNEQNQLRWEWHRLDCCFASALWEWPQVLWVDYARFKHSFFECSWLVDRCRDIVDDDDDCHNQVGRSNRQSRTTGLSMTTQAQEPECTRLQVEHLQVHQH